MERKEEEVRGEDGANSLRLSTPDWQGKGSIAGQDDDLHLLAAFGQTVAIGRPSPVGGQDDLDLVQLVAGRAWDP